MSAGTIISRSAARVTMSTVVAVVGPRGARHDAGNLAELTAHLFDDGAAGASDRLHRKRCEEIGQQAADEEPVKHERIADRKEIAHAVGARGRRRARALVVDELL